MLWLPDIEHYDQSQNWADHIVQDSTGTWQKDMAHFGQKEIPIPRLTLGASVLSWKL